MKWRRKTKSSKDFIKKCKEAASLVEEIPSKQECVSTLEEGLWHIFKFFDQVTRDGIFIALDHICEAKGTAEEALLSADMMKKLESKHPVVHTGIIARSVVDILTKGEYVELLEEKTRQNIIKAVAMRLIMELPADEVGEVATQILPEVQREKEEKRDRHMYG